jgi:peptidoglycan hydrolase-like protein with peptidoglycan-binding domain
MSVKPITVLFCVLALVAVAAVAGWVVGSRIESPAEAAARTAPPTPSPILVPVEERVLSSNVVTRGTARYGMPQPISIAPSVLKADATVLITTLPARNAQFKEGDVMLTTSGRPVFVLQGEIPAYRDLVPGTSGEDVGQLEQGLERLGFDPDPVDGTYDAQTSGAVTEWYKSAGYEPFGPTTEQLANLRTLELALGDATRNKLAAAAAAATAALAVQAAGTKADYANRTAAADLATHANQELARAAVRSAELEGEVAVRAALDAQKVAEFDAQLAAERADQLAAELDEAKRELGVQVPLDEIVFIPALPVRVEEVTGVIGGAVSGPVMSVTDNQIVIDSSLPLDAAPLVKPGMTVAVDEQALGIKTEGVVEMVADTPGTHGVDGYHIYFAVRVGETPSPLEGFSLRLTIPIESTKGVVTTVPISALSLAADGTSRVQVENEGALEYIVVEPGLAADGFVEVAPVDGTLKAGQLVVVGTDNSEPIETQP